MTCAEFGELRLKELLGDVSPLPRPSLNCPSTRRRLRDCQRNRASHLSSSNHDP